MPNLSLPPHQHLHHTFCGEMRLRIRSPRLAQINSVTCHRLKWNDWKTRRISGTRCVTRFANFMEDKWRSCEFIYIPAQWGCHFKKKGTRQGRVRGVKNTRLHLNAPPPSPMVCQEKSSGFYMMTRHPSAVIMWSDGSCSSGDADIHLPLQSVIVLFMNPGSR